MFFIEKTPLEVVFYSYCKDGNLQAIKDLLKANPNISVYGYDNLAFRTALQYGHLHLVQWILSENLILKEEEVFRYACGYGRLEIAKLLLKYKPTIDTSAANNCAFKWAAHYGHLDVAKWLYNYNTQIDKSFFRTAVDWLYNCNTRIDESSFRTALDYACSAGHFEIVKWIYSIKGPSISENSCGLRYALNNGHMEIVQFMYSKPTKGFFNFFQSANQHSQFDYYLESAHQSSQFGSMLWLLFMEPTLSLKYIDQNSREKIYFFYLVYCFCHKNINFFIFKN